MPDDGAEVREPPRWLSPKPRDLGTPKPLQELVVEAPKRQ